MDAPEGQPCAFELEGFDSCCLGPLQAQDLLGYHTQHLGSVRTRAGAGRGEAFTHLAAYEVCSLLCWDRQSSCCGLPARNQDQVHGCCG